MRLSSFYFATIVFLTSFCAAQISIPLTKISIQSSQGYIKETFYVLDLKVKTKEPQTLLSIIDLHSEKSWFADKNCKNCFSSPSFSKEAFSCQNVCGPQHSSTKAIQLAGGKIKATKYIELSPEVDIEGRTVTLKKSYDIIQVKDGYHLQKQKLYLNQIKAGIGISFESAQQQSSLLYQLFKTQHSSPKQISLFFDSNGGRVNKILNNVDISFSFKWNGKYQNYEIYFSFNLVITLTLINIYLIQLLIGNSDKSYGEEGPKLKIFSDEQGKVPSWMLKVGPTIQIKDYPPLSSQVEEPPSLAMNEMHSLKLDSTTKYVNIPFVTWERFNKIIFQHNGCIEDTLKSNICDCSGDFWVPIKFEIILNPKLNTLENNVLVVELTPENYLEKITSGKNMGKCLLLIVPNKSYANLDYVFGTSFLQNYYSIFNFDNQTIVLTTIPRKSNPTEKEFDNNNNKNSDQIMNKKNRNSVILGIAGIIFTLIMFGVLLSILIEPTSVGL